MKEKYDHVFREAVANTLELFAFTFLDHDDEDHLEDLTEDYIYAEMGFSGQADGSVSLSASTSFCNHLATNALGENPGSVDATMSEDALGEMLNVVCGQLTHALHEDGLVCDLTVPSTQHVDQNKWRELLVSCDTVRFWVEGQPLLGRLMIAGGSD